MRVIFRSLKANLFLFLCVVASLMAPQVAQADCYSFPVGVGPENVCFGDFPEETPITVEVGQAIPLPLRYVNNTDREMRFETWVCGNLLFPGCGPRHWVTIAPHTEATYNDFVLQIDPSWPIVTDRIIIGWTAYGGDYAVSVQDEFDITLLAPRELRELIQVPTRWCVMEGSPMAEGKSPGELVDGRHLLLLLQKSNDVVWTPYANIMHRFVFTGDIYGTGIPVIADPKTDYGELGDISYETEVYTFESRCEQAWAELNPNQGGTIIVNARLIGESLGIAPGVSDLKVGRERGDDLCGHPRNLYVNDVTFHQWTVIADLSFFTTAEIFGTPVISKIHYDDPALALSHELGHTLLLGHGNGLDDNDDGLPAGVPGIRRYDEYCDPLGTVNNWGNVPMEDTLPPYESSIMLYKSGTEDVKPLQVEAARAAAKLIPGAIFDEALDPAGALVAKHMCNQPPCGLPPDIFIIKAEVAETPGKNITSFSQTVLGPIPSDANNQYIVFSDLDNDPATGCAPSTLDFPTDFDGAELVTRVAVYQAGGVQEAIPTVWVCQGGTLIQITDPGIHADAFTQTDETGDHLLFDLVSIRIPNSVRGTSGDEVRIQAIARQMTPGRQMDRLPQSPEEGGVISLIPPVLSQCTLPHPVVSPGGVTTIRASGLPPNQVAEVLLGDEIIGAGPTDSTGNMEIDVVIPSTSRQGVRPVVVLVHDTAFNATCALLVQGDSRTPATTATLSPGPNASGWNNGNVTVTLNAVDMPDGPGIKDVNYSASGAQSIAPTGVPADTTSIFVTAEGETVLTYFATNNADIPEAPKTTTVKLDKTLPNITGSRNPDPNLAGWNNADVMVSFTCTDSLSGVLSCPLTTIVTTEGTNQSVTGIALDFAFNEGSDSFGDINIDKTPSAVTYTGNAGMYTVDQVINITCSATDNLSGVAYTNCANISGQAFTFGLGTHTFSSVAIDGADNSGNGSTSFTVEVTYESLCNLTRQFVQKAGVASSLCAKLNAAAKAEAHGNHNAKIGEIKAYKNALAAQSGKSLTADQASILASIVDGL